MTKRGSKKDLTLQDGTVLDDGTVDRVVSEVEDAVLSGRATGTFPRKVRPSLSGRSAASPHVAFRVTSELRDEAEDVARRMGLTISALAREALEECVKKAG